MKPTFFETPDELREWLRAHHHSADELLVGLYKKDSGSPSVTWPQLVDQLLCFGWIDGVRKTVDENSYTIRVTPRRARSIWSAVNLKRAQELIALGLMEPAGLAAYEARDEERTRIYSYERAQAALGEEQENLFRGNPNAWKFFESQPPSYRRLAAHWVMSAKREDTRRRRLATLIQDSATGQRIGPLKP